MQLDIIERDNNMFEVLTPQNEFILIAYSVEDAMERLEELYPGVKLDIIINTI